MKIPLLSISGFPFPPVEKQTPDAGSSQAQKFVLETKKALNESRLRLLKEIPVPGKLSPYSRPAASTVASQGGAVYAQRLPDNTLILRDQESHGKRAFIELKPDNTLGRVLLDGKEIRDLKLKAHPKTLQDVKKIVDLYFEKTAGSGLSDTLTPEQRQAEELLKSQEKGIEPFSRSGPGILEFKESEELEKEAEEASKKREAENDGQLAKIQPEICTMNSIGAIATDINYILSSRLHKDNPGKDAFNSTTFRVLKSEQVIQLNHLVYYSSQVASKNFPCAAVPSKQEIEILEQTPFPVLVEKQKAFAQQLLILSRAIKDKDVGTTEDLDRLLREVDSIAASLAAPIVQLAQQEGMKIPK